MDDPDADWECLLPLVMLAYNTIIHQSTQTSPFFLTFLHDPNLPYFDLDNEQPVYGEDWATTTFQRAKIAFKRARDNMQKVQKIEEKYYNPGTKRMPFKVQETVCVKFPRSFFTKITNKKFVRTWLNSK